VTPKEKAKESVKELSKKLGITVDDNIIEEVGKLVESLDGGLGEFINFLDNEISQEGEIESDEGEIESDEELLNIDSSISFTNIFSDENKSKILVQIGIPGLDGQSVKISIENNSLIVKGKSVRTKSTSSRKFSKHFSIEGIDNKIHEDFSFGEFITDIVLPDSWSCIIDVDYEILPGLINIIVEHKEVKTYK